MPPPAASTSTSRRAYLDRDIKILWSLASGRCTICRVELIAEPSGEDRHVVLGKQGHIYAHSPGGPRYDATKAEVRGFLRSYENLVLVCGPHHDTVDGQESTFTVDELLRLKRAHEAWVHARLAQAAPNVGFPELEVVCGALQAPPALPALPNPPTAPAEKLSKNRLTREVHTRVLAGLSFFPLVEDYVEMVTRLDDRFPERLRAGFLEKYEDFRQCGLDGDALFAALHDYASSGSSDFTRQAAGLGVLCYLFQKCEVFEP